MEIKNLEIQEIRFKDLDSNLVESYLDLQEAIHSTSGRGEVLRSRDFRKKRIYEPDKDNDRFVRLLAIRDGKVIGFGTSHYKEIENDPNPRSIEFDIEVHPHYRRQRVGTKLFQYLDEKAKLVNRDKLEAWITPIDGDHVTQFCRHLGFKKVSEEKCSRLYRDSINMEYISRQEEKYRDQLQNYQFKIVNRQEWADWILEDDSIAEEMADFVTEVLGLIPKDDIDAEPYLETAANLKESAKRIKKTNNVEAYNIYVLDGEKIIAMSGTYYPFDPPVRDVGTGLTGVRKDYHRKGLATMLKIRIIHHYLEEFPEFEYIFTENASSNKGMLGININLGFREAFTWEMWQRIPESI